MPETLYKTQIFVAGKPIEATVESAAYGSDVQLIFPDEFSDEQRHRALIIVSKFFYKAGIDISGANLIGDSKAMTARIECVKTTDPAHMNVSLEQEEHAENRATDAQTLLNKITGTLEYIGSVSRSATLSQDYINKALTGLERHEMVLPALDAALLALHAKVKPKLVEKLGEIASKGTFPVAFKPDELAAKLVSVVIASLTTKPVEFDDVGMRRQAVMAAIKDALKDDAGYAAHQGATGYLAGELAEAVVPVPGRGRASTNRPN